MSFRIEDKYLVKKEDKIEILSFIKNDGFEEKYKKRNITSIYFDNKFLSMFEDSEEGVTPRKKIRLRFYENNKEDLNFEEKINSQEGKYKISNKLSLNKMNFYINNGYYDSSYGNCYPILIVNYDRFYFQKNNYRITLDFNICFKNFINKNFKFNEDFLILEVKLLNKYNIPIELENLPLNKIRYSKYSEGIKKVYNKVDKDRLYF